MPYDDCDPGPPDTDAPRPCSKCKGYHEEEGVEACPKPSNDEAEEDAMRETYESLNFGINAGIARDIRRNGGRTR